MKHQSEKLVTDKKDPALDGSAQKRAFFNEHCPQLLKQEAVFKKIFAALDQRWQALSDQDKNKIIDLINDLLIATRAYHHAFLALNGAANARNEWYQTTEDYQENIKNADIRERAAHQSFVDALNLLSRTMAALKIDNSWRKDDQIYGLTPTAEREKTREWMLRVVALL